jgi:hypothetical protein
LPDVILSAAEIRMTTGYVELLARPLKAFPAENFYFDNSVEGAFKNTLLTWWFCFTKLRVPLLCR